MSLTELQRKKLIDGVNSLPIKTVLTYFQTGEINYSDVPHITEERRAYIDEQISLMPNPEEQAEWKAIESMLDNPTHLLLEKLSVYIRNWEVSRPSQNHVDLARGYYERVEEQLMDQAASLEKSDWDNVDPFAVESLVEHLTKYPHTVHRNEIDDAIWSLTNKDIVGEIQVYKNYFPNGAHVSEADQILNAIVQWTSVKNTGDIFAVNNYMKQYPDSPFISDAKMFMLSLKQTEMKRMRTNPNEYSAQSLLRLLDDNVFTENELIISNVLTKAVLDSLRNTNIMADLPDIRKAIQDSVAECKDGYTDVFFFGVPSTGKTCVLMGMSRSNSLHINLASGGGDYASALQQFTDVGMTVPRTPGTFVTTLEATITSNKNKDAVHRINLVEMSGEEFAFGIAANPEHVFQFEDMGTGATELLNNDNRKVFFLIIDPTANVVRINREVVDGYDEETGKPVTRLEHCVVNQRILIQKMVDIFNNPGNAEIMRKVDSIHIIMTKSDTLGNPVERDEKAYKIFQDKFGSNVLDPLYEVCMEYNINQQTDFRPKLFTFSLGTFYVGGLYEYEPTDSNRLVKAIRNSTSGYKKKSWWDRLKETVNK